MPKYFAWYLAAIISATLELSAQPVSSPTEYRPQPFDVQHYELDMTIVNPYSKKVDGRVAIIVRWEQDVEAPSFPVHARGISIDAVTRRGQTLDARAVGNDAVDTFHFRIDLPEPVTTGMLDTLTVFYSGVMTTEGGQGAWGGVWYEGQVLYALGVGFHNPNVSATQHWMPCYDHPSDKATFRGTFRVPSDQVVASIGRLEAVNYLPGDPVQEFVWTEDHPTATYLYTFAVGQFEKLELTEVGVPHEVYSLARDTAASRVTYSLVPEMTRMYERHFLPYPFDKVGYVNTRRGAMEHQTLISMPTSEVDRRDSTSSTVAHELAHMWFGDLVTPLDFRHAWLTESFATFGEALW